MKNYRVTFGGEGIDYHKAFEECRKYMPIIRRILDKAKEKNIEYIWYFFEPYVEITWIDESYYGSFLDEVIDILLDEGIKRYKTFTPRDGNFADWFGKTDQEKSLGYKRYAKIAELSRFLLDNHETIENGMGYPDHFTRCTHALANQLGLNYLEEGTALLKRSILCLLYYVSPNPETVYKTWEKIFNQKFNGG